MNELTDGLRAVSAKPLDINCRINDVADELLSRIKELRYPNDEEPYEIGGLIMACLIHAELQGVHYILNLLSPSDIELANLITARALAKYNEVYHNTQANNKLVDAIKAKAERLPF